MQQKNRMDALRKMVSQLKDESFSKVLVDSYMEDTDFLRKDVVIREVLSPIDIVSQIGVPSEYPAGYSMDIETRRPLGKVAILLPYNGINIPIAKAVCSSFFAGNETIIRLPRKLKRSERHYRQLISGCLSGVEFAPSGQPAEDFLNRCIESPDISAIVVYGDDQWIWGYKNKLRQHYKKLIFEGPGKDPQVVMKDADLEKAVADAIACGMLNGGQSCSAIERFFVHRDIEHEFVGKLVGELSRLKAGHAEDEEAAVGPIGSPVVLHRMIEQVKDARQKGATVVYGGMPIELGKGKTGFRPTVIQGCTTAMQVIQQETFGPVFPILSFSSEADLVSQVDDSTYGLNASIYGTTSDRFIRYMDNNHRNLYFNSTVTSPANRYSRIIDGGFRNSGFIWEWENGSFIQREGKRLLLKELSVADR